MTAPILPKLIGSRIKRREDPRLVTGQGSFVDDMQLPGMLHLAFKRCDIAHGTITGIDTSAAAAMPSVEAVYTGAQVQEVLPPMPVLTPFPAPVHHAIAADHVRHVGEPVAVVVATDRYLAQDAADTIEVEYEELPAVTNPEAAIGPDAPVLHEVFVDILEQSGTNVALAMPVGTGVDPVTMETDDTAVDAAFAEADVVVSERIFNQRLAPTPIEPRGSLANYDRGLGQLTFWSSTQGPHLARTYIASALGMGENDVRVIATDVGGAFGAKINIHAEDFVAAALDIEAGSIKSARVGLTGATTHAVRLPEVEEALAGNPATTETFDAAAAAATAGSSVGFVNTDIHGSEDYRRAMIKVFTKRALEAAAD